MGKTAAKSKKWKIYLFFIPVVIGVFVLFLSTKKEKTLQTRKAVEKSYSVRIIEVPAVNFAPRTVGHGNVEPGTTWQAIAEVSGKIVKLHPKLKKGGFVKAGSVIIKIDATDYELAIQQQKANILSIQSQSPELRIQESNTHASLEIERRALAVAEKELRRLRALARKGAGSRKAVDQQERGVLGQKQSVQTLQNTLNLFPSQQKILAAQLAVAKTQLDSAKINLQRTTITIPFDARIADVQVERSQFIKQGQLLVVADSIDLVEISAQFSFEKIRNLYRANGRI
ncbi:MAG: biotin/lipoyl-binding protein, partial [Proteobacteria bacterium]|nr:biotin/lipoyl-binding protein [Pseudomonadota bacterium]